MKRLTLLAIVVCLSLTVHFVQPVAAKDTWTSVRSRNFFLIGNASEKEIKQVGTKLEQFREVFTRLFKSINFNALVPTTVVVFKSDSSYRPFKLNSTTAGYFQAGADVNYITLTTEVRGEQNPYTVIFHEYTHLLVNNTIGDIPAWFNEGLAEYYSTFNISNDQKIVLGNPIANHVYLLRESKMLPLRTLFQVDHDSPYYNERDKQSIFYAESWALMHYLILGNNGQRVTQMADFIRLMDQGKTMEKAFDEAFKTTFEAMEKELREYIKRDRYPIITGAFEQKVSFDTEMQAAPISEAEAQAYLGDLLLHSNRTESESYLQKALALEPTLAMANASMGMLRVRQGKLDEARQSLERAAAANSKNYLIHYYYAFALSRQGMNDSLMVSSYSPELLARMREELNTAITLRPDFIESYSLLVFINLVSGTQLDESIALLRKALAISPGRNDLLFMLAQLYLRKEDIKTSRQILARLSQSKSDAHIRQQAQTLLKEVENIEEQMARYRSSPERGESASTGPAPALDTRSSATGPPVVQEKLDPSKYLREALRKPAEGEKQIQGMLLRVECDAKGITFVVQVGDQTLRVKTDKFENVDITAYTTEAGSSIGCGPRKPQNPVVVCYVPATDSRAKVDGSLISLEFVPAEFKLNP